jgi:two-component system phosphate regulon sensor histidine kinase PhoR
LKPDFRFKLASLFSGLALLALALLYVYSGLAVREFALASARERLRVDAGLVSDLVSEELAKARPRLGGLARRLSGQLHERVTILAVGGEVLGDSSEVPGGRLDFEHQEGRRELAEAARTGFGEAQRFSAVMRQEVLYAATRLGEGKKAVLVRVGRPAEPIVGAFGPLSGRIGWAFLVAAGALVALAFGAAHAITSPLRSLVALAERVEQGELKAKVRPYGEDEFSRLGRALDHVGGRLERELIHLRAEKERLETILREMAEPVMVTDVRGLVVLVNDAFKRTFQLGGEAGAGKRAFELVRVSVFQDKLEEVLGQGAGSASFQIEMQHPAKLVLAGNIVALSGAGVPGGALIVFHDITELKRLEQIRKDFIANISHELRTPLSSIRGYAETLAEGGLEDRERAQRFAGIIKRHAERLSDLLSDILSLSRIESGEAALRPREFDMVQAVVEDLEQLKQKAEAKGISTQVEASAEVLPVMASREFIDQVLINLIDNAIKYSPPGAAVVVRVSSDEREVRVDVADTGIGIPAEDLDRVFERFYRVAKDRSRKVEGTGLGLAIAKNIIATHGGRIWVTSEPGRGSVFSFTLPAA